MFYSWLMSARHLEISMDFSQAKRKCSSCGVLLCLKWFNAQLFIFRTCGWCQSPGTEGCERSVDRTEFEDLRRGLAQQDLWTKASHQDQDWDRCDSNKSSKSMFFFSIFYTIIFKLLFAENYKIVCLHIYPFCAPKEA